MTKVSLSDFTGLQINGFIKILRCQGPRPKVVCLGMGIFISFDTTAPTYWEDLPEALRKIYLGFLVSEY